MAVYDIICSYFTRASGAAQKNDACGELFAELDSVLFFSAAETQQAISLLSCRWSSNLSGGAEKHEEPGLSEDMDRCM